MTPRKPQYPGDKCFLTVPTESAGQLPLPAGQATSDTTHDTIGRTTALSTNVDGTLLPVSKRNQPISEVPL